MIHLKHVKHLWKYTILVLAVALLASALALSVSAKDTVYTGKVGSVTWTMNVTTGELSLTGSGGIFSAPWASYKASIKKVTVADTVTSIPTNAFSDCTNLTEVDLGNGVTYLWDNAFRNCTALTEITFPDSLSYVYYSVFTGCTALERVHISSVKEWLEINFVNENSNPCLKGGELYVNGERVTELVIPEGTVVINGNAFSGMTQLESVFVSEGVISIGNFAFHNCGELTRVTLPASLCTLGQNVFEGTTPALILFEGTDEQWQNVSVGEGNEAFQSAVIPHAGHTYDREIADSRYWLHDADCERAQTYLKSCVCGEAGTDTFTVGDPLGHTGGEATCSERAVCTVCHSAYGDTLPHTPGTPATCTESQICKICHTVLNPKTGHSYKVTVTPATCTEKGYTTHTCTVCSHSYEDTYTAIVSHTPGTPATCTEAQTCTVCHTVLTPKTGHSYTESVTPATCTEGGYTTHTCTVCDHSYVDSYTAMADHIPGPEATCTEAQSCTVCHTVLAEKTPHDYTQSVTPATCTDEGYTTHTCTRCGFAYVDSVLQPTGHRAGAAATCDLPQTCTECHSVLQNALGHSYEEEITPPTCTAEGYTTHTCTRCDVAYHDAITAPTGHRAGPEATCSAMQTCTACGAMLADRLEHTFEDSVIQPTCTEAGYTARTCTHCGMTRVEEPTPATGHTPGEWVTDKEPALGEEGQRHRPCTVCGTVVTLEKIPALEADTNPGEAGTQEGNDPSEGTAEDPSDGTTGDPSEVTDETPDSEHPDESLTESDTLSADDLLGNLSGCKKAQTITVYILIGVVMLITATIFWVVDSRRRSSFL